MLGANGIVGAGYAIAAGAALNAKVTRNGRVALVFFGDGAITRGTFHEVMNMASLWKLSLLLVCENNEYAQYMHRSDTMVFDNIATLASNYHMPGVQLDGNDVRLVHSTVSAAAQRARAGDGPTLIELKTQRFQGHSSGDLQVYRSKASVEELRRTRDPIARLLYGTKGPVPDGSDWLIPFGTAAVVRQGADLTIVTTGLMVSRALEAAAQLEQAGISAEIIDLRTVSPIDWETIFESVDKTGRALIVNEATLTCSVASEIAATIGEKRFSSLDGPVRRLGSPFVPKPSTPGLEKLAYPSVEGIVRTATEMMPRRRSA